MSVSKFATEKAKVVKLQEVQKAKKENNSRNADLACTQLAMKSIFSLSQV